jgi:hypothetical protein
MQGASYLSNNGFESQFLGPRRDIPHEEKLGEGIRNRSTLLLQVEKNAGVDV